MSATVFDMPTYRRLDSETAEEKELRKTIVHQLRRCRVNETVVGNAVAEGKRRLNMRYSLDRAVAHAIGWALEQTKDQ